RPDGEPDVLRDDREDEVAACDRRAGLLPELGILGTPVVDPVRAHLLVAEVDIGDARGVGRDGDALGRGRHGLGPVVSWREGAGHWSSGGRACPATYESAISSSCTHGVRNANSV